MQTCLIVLQVVVVVLVVVVVCTEGHILEDVNKCVLALQQRDADMFDRTAGAIRGRCARVCNVVSAEMFNYAPGPYTDRVMETVVELRDRSELLL